MAKAMEQKLAELEREFPHMNWTNGYKELLRIMYISGESAGMKRATKMLEETA